MVVRRHREAGFTYVGLIVLVAIIGLVGAATMKADALLRRAAAEQELLEIGAAFSAALTSYAEATPRGQLPQPPSLEALLKDPRVPGTRRHLRKIFVDPITGKAEWGVQYQGEQGGVIAVYSLSTSRPLKIGNFDQRFSGFDNRKHISDWKFAATGTSLVNLPVKESKPGTAEPPPERDESTPQPLPFPSRGNLPGRAADKPPEEREQPKDEPKEEAKVEAPAQPPEKEARPADTAPPEQDGNDR
jgi:type II secretory pathway pseudopilin PulG